MHTRYDWQSELPIAYQRCWYVPFFFLMGFPRAPLCVASGGLAPLPEGPGSHTLRRQSPLPTPYPTRTSGASPRLPSMLGIGRRDTPLKNVNPEEGQVPWGASPDAQLNIKILFCNLDTRYVALQKSYRLWHVTYIDRSGLYPSSNA